MDTPEYAKGVLVRHIRTSLKVAWDLWTTPEGISAWWGPAGSAPAVDSMDVTVGGKLFYKLHVTRPDRVQQMKDMGLTTTILNGEVIYTEVVPERRLAYLHLNDWIPGVEPYWNLVEVDLHPSLSGVEMVITWSPLHNAAFTRLLAEAFEDELADFMLFAEPR